MCPLETPGQAPLDTSAEFSQQLGSLAHDVNNLLTAILGYANLVARTFDDRDPRRSDVAEIIRAAQQAGVLSHELLVLSGRRARPGSTPSEGVNSRNAAAASTDRVLVVDDERAVRYLVQTVLARAGYDIRQASNSEEAQAWLAEHATTTVNLLITDIGLPGGNGHDLYQRALARYPSLKVLYMSGYSDETIRQDRLLEPGAPFIQKPFTGEELSRKVREVLDTN